LTPLDLISLPVDEGLVFKIGSKGGKGSSCKDWQQIEKKNE
jgi:hypothetical protein